MSDAATKAPSAHGLAVLRDPATIRLRSQAILKAVENNLSAHWRLNRAALPAVAQRVAKLTRDRFPDLRTPYHSRWRHFEAGGVDRKATRLDPALAGLDAAETARAHFDLTVVSVLLDAGAGGAWRYDEAGTGQGLLRSEGLGVASFHGFVGGAFSADRSRPCRVDAAALQQLDAAALRAIFQSSPSNPLLGLEGRAGLMQRLGAALAAAAGGLEARPAQMFDRLTDGGRRSTVAAADILGEVLATLSPIWTSGSRVMGQLAGDVWPHRWAGHATPGNGYDRSTGEWVPFHKLSQWLSYSLLEPLQWAGITVTGLEALTGLPEYRNGGLLMDGGVLQLRHPEVQSRPHKPGDELVIEWRACTVALLDEIAELVREQLGVDAATLPLACVLEGGTWAAGRALARELRTDGSPPLKIDSDGTLF